MFKFSVLVMIFAFGPCTLLGFMPGPQFFKTVPHGKSLDLSIKQLDKQQALMNETTKSLNEQINQLLTKASMGQSKDVNFVNQTITNLSSLVKQALSKVSAVESQTSTEVSTLRSHLERVRDDFSTLQTLVANISSEITTMKKPDRANKLQEAKQRENDGPCPTSKGYHQLSGKFCIRHSGREDIRGWNDSMAACQRDGGDLISFNTEDEQEQVMKYFNGLGSEAHAKNYAILRSWVGMYRIEDQFSWNSGSTFYGKWTRNGPRDKSFLKCVSLVYDGLDDTLCGLEFRFICQIKM